MPAMPLIDLGQDTSASAHPGGPGIPANGLQPGISLETNGAKQGNGLSTLADFANVQQQMTAARTAAGLLNARVRAGQILSQSPDLETGMKAMAADPVTGQYYGEISSGIRQGMLAQVQASGEIQKQSLDGFGAAKAGLAAVANNPTQNTWDAVTQPVLANLSPNAKAQVGPALDSLKSHLFSDLPNDPQAAQAMVKSRIAGLMAGSPDVMGLMYGRPDTKDLGGSLIPGMTSQTTGAFAPAGNALGKSLPPTVVHGVGSEGQDITTVMGGGHGGNALGGGVVPPGGNGVTIPVARPPNAQTPAPNGAIIGPTQTQSQYNTKRTDDIADYQKSLDDRVQNGSTLRKNIDETIQAATQAQMGGGAEAYTKLGSALQAIGVKNPTVDKWANGSLAASQVIDKVALQNSMSQLKQQLTGVGGSRLNAQEFVAYLNKNPNLTTDPRAATQIFQLWNQFYDRDKTEQVAFDKFKQGKPTGDQSLDQATAGNPDIKRWPALWNQSDYMAKFAPGGHIDTSGVRGMGGAATVTHSWNPATKQIEAVPAASGP